MLTELSALFFLTLITIVWSVRIHPLVTSRSDVVRIPVRITEDPTPRVNAVRGEVAP